MSVTSLTLSVDKAEYSRYTKDHVVTVHIAPTAAVLGDQLTVTLERTDRAGVVATQTASLQTAQATCTLTFDLMQVADPVTGQNRVVAGDYLCRATLVGTPSVTAATSIFAISLVTVAELRSTYLYGATLYASEVGAPRFQPSLVTGVTISEVSRYHDFGPFVLSYTAGTPAMLSWAGGAAVALPPAGSGPVTLGLLDKRASSGYQGDYVIATIDTSALPAASVSEVLLIDVAVMPDADLVRYVRAATGWVETKLGWYIEPRKVVTSLLAPQYTDYDFVVDAAVFYSFPAVASWLMVDLPLQLLTWVYELDGYMNQGKVTNIPPGWIQWNELAGEIELVPSAGQALTIMFTGTPFFSFYYNYADIPNFWQYCVMSGLRDLLFERAPVREAVAKKAAIEILYQAGSAYRAGYASESSSRDGISSSQSYTASAQFGVYAHVTGPYLTWLEENLPAIRQRLGGLQVMVMQ